MITYVLKPEKIKSRRDEMGLTLRELAEKVGVNHGTISYYETGSKVPSAAILGKIAAVLKVTPTFFYEKEKSEE